MVVEIWKGKGERLKKVGEILREDSPTAFWKVGGHGSTLLSGEFPTLREAKTAVALRLNARKPQSPPDFS